MPHVSTTAQPDSHSDNHQHHHRFSFKSTKSTGAVFHSRFLRHNAILFFGAISVGVLNYAYYPIMGRLLRPDSFGEVQALFSLFAQIAIFLNVLSLITVTIVANYTDQEKQNRMVTELERLALLCSMIILIITALAAPLLQSFFHFGHSLPFILLAVAVLAGTPLAFRSGFLRGKQKFGLVTMVGIAASVGNIVFSAGLAIAGFGSAGALAGLAVGQTAGFVLAAVLARRHGLAERAEGLSDSRALKKLTKRFRAINFKLIAPELRYAGLVLVGSLAVTGMYSLDTIVVKHYFDAHTAGLYAGIATIARIIFFATASVLQVMLSSVKVPVTAKESGQDKGFEMGDTNHSSTSHNSRLLGKSLALLIIIGGLPLALFALFRSQVIELLMGSAYLPYAYLLPWTGLAMFIIAIFNLLIMYHIALRRFTAGYIALAGIVATYLLIGLHHQTVGQIVASLCLGSCLSLVLLGIWSGSRFITRAQKGGVLT